MSYYVLCTENTTPCPAFSQTVQQVDYAALGITGESLATAVGAGFGIIFTFAIIGLSAGSIIKLFRQL